MMANEHNNILQRGASARQLERAAAFNHTELFCANARAVGGEVHQNNGLVWTHSGSEIESMIAFPELNDDNAAVVLDDIMGYYLAQPPSGVGCWSLDPPQPADLGVRLLARGFQPGWQPNWMALDMNELNLDHPVPDGLQIIADNNTSLEAIKQLPYGETNTKIFSRQEKGLAFSQRFVATINGNVVAHCSVLLTTGELGAAGIYHVGVLPRMRNQGVGKAVVGEACKYAKDLGYHYALLNGTGYKMYAQLGFTRLGKGHTWWLTTSRLLAHPPTPNDIEIVEAVGRGDNKALKKIGNDIKGYDLVMPLTNGMTLMQLAVHCKQPASAEWLMSHGLAIDVISAWDLGWKDEAARILSNHPEQANLQYGDGELTLLHMAVERNDLTLAKLVLSANPDLGIKDKNYKSTSLDWARHLGRIELTSLLEEHAAQSKA